MAGFAVPHSVQNLPVFIVPHLGQAHSEEAGFAVPHSVQNLPVFVAPHLGHAQPAEGAVILAACSLCCACAARIAAMSPLPAASAAFSPANAMTGPACWFFAASIIACVLALV